MTTLPATACGFLPSSNCCVSIHPTAVLFRSLSLVSQFVAQFVFLLPGLLVVVWYALSMVYLKPTGGWTSDDSWRQRLTGFLEEARSYIMLVQHINYVSNTKIMVSLHYILFWVPIYHGELSACCCCIVLFESHGEVDEAAPAPVQQATPATSSRHGAGGPGKVAKLSW